MSEEIKETTQEEKTTPEEEFMITIHQVIVEMYNQFWEDAKINDKLDEMINNKELDKKFIKDFFMAILGSVIPVTMWVATGIRDHGLNRYFVEYTKMINDTRANIDGMAQAINVLRQKIENITTTKEL